MLRHVTLYSDIFSKKVVYDFVAHSKKEVIDTVVKFKQEHPFEVFMFITQELVNKRLDRMYDAFHEVLIDEKTFDKHGIKLSFVSNTVSYEE